MIYDTLSHIFRYDGMHEGVRMGLNYLRDTDFSRLPDGPQEIDGKNVFANIMTVETKPGNDTPEAHRTYIDIQYLISGREHIDVGPLEAMVEEVSGKPEIVIWFYHGPLDRITIGDGRYAVLFPGDAHAPGIQVDGPETVRKVVVKVLADWSQRK